MTEYIVKEQALRIVYTAFEGTNYMEDAWAYCTQKLRALPPADVVDVVRCKDCKYRSMEAGEFDGLEPACRFWTDVDAIYPVFVDMNGFCSEGKRKEGESND